MFFLSFTNEINCLHQCKQQTLKLLLVYQIKQNKMLYLTSQCLYRGMRNGERLYQTELYTANAITVTNHYREMTLQWMAIPRLVITVTYNKLIVILIICQILAELWDKITLTFFLKCLSGAHDLLVLHPDRVSVKPRREGLRGDRCVLTTPRSTFSAYLASFFPRTVNLFQSLPEVDKVKHAPSLLA